MFNKPEYIIIHHSATSDTELNETESIEQYHREVKLWGDIGYHYLIETIGNEIRLTYGRKPYEKGAHALGFNDNSIGVCLVGDYDQKPLQIEKRDKLIKFVRSLQSVFDIKTDHVIGHRETYPLRGVPVAKTCPGMTINMDELRRMIDSVQYLEV